MPDKNADDRIDSIDTLESSKANPELVTEKGIEAKEFAQRLVPDSSEVIDADTLRTNTGTEVIRTVRGKGKFGRNLTKVEIPATVNGVDYKIDMALVMMQQDFSNYYTKYGKNPNPVDHDKYKHYYSDFTKYELSGAINTHTGLPLNGAQDKQGKEYESLNDAEYNLMAHKSEAFDVADIAFKEGKISRENYERALVDLFGDEDMLLRFKQDQFDRTQPKFNDGSLRYRAGILQQDPTQRYITNLAKANTHTMSATVRPAKETYTAGEKLEASFETYNTVAMLSNMKQLHDVRNYGKTEHTTYTAEEIIEGAPAAMHSALLEEAELNNGMSAIVMKEQWMENEKNNEVLANLGMLESLGYGFLPFLIDIPTLITGGAGVALKGTVMAGRSAIMRTAPAWSKTGVDFGLAATTWGTAAAFDEGMRASVRLTADHTYTVKNAQMDIGIAFGVGAVLPVVGKSIAKTPWAKDLVAGFDAIKTAEANRKAEFNTHKGQVDADVTAGRTHADTMFGDFVVDTTNVNVDTKKPFQPIFEYTPPPTGILEQTPATPIMVDKVNDLPPVVMTNKLNARHYLAELEDDTAVQAAYKADVEASEDKVSTGIQEQFVNSGEKEQLKDIHKKGLADYVADVVSMQWLGNAFQDVGSRFQKSGLDSLAWVGTTVTETARGFKGKVNRKITAALVKDRENHLSQMRIAPQYVEGVTAYAASKGKGALGQLNAGTMDSNNPIVDAFHREVFSYQEARRRGRSTEGFHESVMKVADDWDNYMSHNHDTLVKSGVDNFTAERKIKHYIPRKWSIAKTQSAIRKHGKSNVLRMIIKSMDELDSRAASKDITNNKERAEKFLEDIMGDQSITNAGEAAQRAIDLDDAFTPTTDIHSRARMDLDLDVGIDGLSMMDLVHTDLPEIWTKYSERMSAQVGLAKATNGVISSPLDIQVTRQLIEQEAIDKGLSRSEMNKAIGMFDDTMDTLFGRPTKYFNTGSAISRAEKILTGTNYTGIPKSVRQLKDITALTQLGGLGAAQASEIGATITRTIMQTWNDGGSVKGLLKKSGVDVDDPQALKTAYHEIQEITGITDEIEWMDRQSVHLDQHEQANIGTLTRAGDAVVDALTFGKYKAPAARLLGKTTGFNALRRKMNNVAQSSAVLDLVRQAKHGKGSMSKQRRMDLGLEDQSIYDEINKHVELNDDGYVVALNFDQWKPEVMEKLALGIHRDTAQSVQRTLVGERPAWLNRPLAQLLTQYMEMPIVAMNKQLGRNIAFADKEAVVGMSAQAAIAGTVMYSWKELSRAVTGNDQEPADITDVDSLVKSKGFQALKYTPFVGVVPDVLEWVNAGLQGEEKNIPLMSTLNNYYKTGEEVEALATGTGSKKDLMDTAVRLVPLSNTIYAKALAEWSAKLADEMKNIN